MSPANNPTAQETAEKTTAGSRFSVQRLVRVALCTAVTAILAPISVPMAGGVPISLATFAVMLSGVLLGACDGALCQLLYVLLGSVGVPVFAGWTAGIGRVLGVTGGYILGYIPMAFVIGFLFERLSQKGIDRKAMFLSLCAGDLVLYLFGTAWFMLQSGMNLTASLAACVLPFLPGDLIKIIAVLFVAPPVISASRHFSDV